MPFPPPPPTDVGRSTAVPNSLNAQVTSHFDNEVSVIRTHLDTAERKLTGLRSVFGDDIVNRAMSRRPNPSKGRGVSRSIGRQVNPAVAASRRLQGEYMGLMRHLTGRERSRIKKIAAEKGREAAVKEMRSLQN